MVDEDLRPEDVGAASHEGRGHRGACIAERAYGRDVRGLGIGVVDEVVEERRREVERRDALLGDQPERLAGVPARLRDEAAADEVHRDERMDAHRVVERHHAERPVAPRVTVLQRLRPAPRTVRRVRARHALRPPGRPRRVEEERRLALVEVQRAGVLGAVGQRIAVADHERRAAVLEAIAEVILGKPPGEWDDDRACPLAGPVEKRGLEPVVEHDRHALARVHAQPACNAPHSRQELAVREPGERVELGLPLAGGEQRLREVHARATSSIASTIGA